MELFKAVVFIMPIVIDHYPVFIVFITTLDGIFIQQTIDSADH